MKKNVFWLLTTFATSNRPNFLWKDDENGGELRRLTSGPSARAEESGESVETNDVGKLDLFPATIVPQEVSCARNALNALLEAASMTLGLLEEKDKSHALETYRAIRDSLALPILATIYSRRKKLICEAISASYSVPESGILELIAGWRGNVFERARNALDRLSASESEVLALDQVRATESEAPPVAVDEKTLEDLYDFLCEIVKTLDENLDPAVDENFDENLK